MKSEKIYDDWVERKNQVLAENDFSEKVIGKIFAYEKERRVSVFYIPAFVEMVSAHPWVQAAMITIGAIVGLVRVVLTLHIVLCV